MLTEAGGDSISSSDSTAAGPQIINTCESNVTNLVQVLELDAPLSSAPMDEQKLMHTTSKHSSSSINNDTAEEEHQSSPPDPSPPWHHKERKLSVLPLIFLIYYEVSGGPFGVEDAVGAGGPFLALIGFIIFPFIWSLPEVFITAELGTMFPEDGGYVVWVSSALGPYWGFQVGWVKWLSGVIDNTIYPFMLLDYLKSGIPALAHGYPRGVTALALTLVLTFVNFRGLTIVGWAAVVIGSFHLVPFLVMMIVSLPKIRPRRWLVAKDLRSVKWKLYLNTLFWNLNFWDSISTLVGEVRHPKKSLPKALFFALILVVCSYFFPVLCSTGAVVVEWKDGSFSTVAKRIGGDWLSWWIQCASSVSTMGMFLSEMSSDSFQLLGMAERGMLPEFFAKRSRYGTPLIAILIAILFSSWGFLLHSRLPNLRDVIEFQNFLYCVGMILELVAFIRLRMRYPNASRPYKIPGGTAVVVLICIPPMMFICVVLALSTANLKVFIPGLAAVMAGLILRPCLNIVERKKWVKFSTSSHLPRLPGQFQSNIISPI